MGKRIILVDDNITSLMLVSLLLRRFDCMVMPVKSGIEALRLLALANADLMIVDVHMHDMDGFTLLRYIKADKRTAHIPVIMVSIDTSSETIDKCKSLGCFDFLAKPLKVKEIYDSIQRCFFKKMGTSRRHIRTRFMERVLLQHDGKEYNLYAETLSEGGIYLRKEKPLPVKSRVEVSMPVGNGQTTQVAGTIIYVKHLLGDFLTLSPGMAIQFDELDQGTAKTLRIFIEHLVAKDIFDEQGQTSLVDDRKETTAKGYVPANNISIRKPRVIVCDDDKMILRLFKSVLEKRGYEVLTADTPITCAFYRENAKSCPQHARCTDILITDNSMPGMNGIELLEMQHKGGCKLTSKNKALMSSMEDATLRKRAEALGCNFFLKPVLINNLFAWVKECEERADLSEPLPSELYLPSRKEPLYVVPSL